MFVQAKGSFGFAIERSDQVQLFDSEVMEVNNTGVGNTFMCENTWWLWDFKDYLGPVARDYDGADVHGILMDDVSGGLLRGVSIDFLNADEGRATALDLVGMPIKLETGSLFGSSQPAVSMDRVTVGDQIKAGKGSEGFVSMLTSDFRGINLGGFKSAPPPSKEQVEK